MQENPSQNCFIDYDGRSRVFTVRPFSVQKVFFSLLYMLFWNGIASIFVFLNTMATLKLLGFAIPVWVNEINVDGEPGFPVSTGQVIFFWVFLTPFITIGLALAGSFFNTLLGSFQVIFDDHAIKLSSGFSFLKYNRTLQRNQVTSIDIRLSFWKSNGQYSSAVAFNGDKEKRIGYGLNHDQLLWLESACRSELDL